MAPRLRCERCGRVREAPGQDWYVDEDRWPGEVLGSCKLCADLLRIIGERRWRAQGRRLLRERARGYGNPIVLEDVFRGMRESKLEPERKSTMPVPENLDTKDIAPPSNHIKAAEFPANWRAELQIEDVNVDVFKREGEREKKKFILTFVGKTKTFVVNETNKAFLEAALGSKPSKWIGAKVQLSIAKVKYQGGMVPGFLIVGATPPIGGNEPGNDQSSSVPF